MIGIHSIASDEFCKEGFDLRKGECLNLSIPQRRKCPNGYYLSGNKQKRLFSEEKIC